MSELVQPFDPDSLTAQQRSDARGLESIRAAYHVAPSAWPLLDRLARQKSLGSGRCKIVYDYEPGKVVSLFRYKDDHSIDDLKAIYYRRNLAHILLPQYMPKVYFAAASPDRLVSEKIEGTSADNLFGSTSAREAVSKTIQAFGHFGISVDSIRRSNFIIDSSGNAVYVDGLEWEADAFDRIEKSISLLTQSQQSMAERFMRRAVQLPNPREG